MKKEFNHNFYGLILSIGGIVHLLTNMFWKIIPIERIGEWLYFFGLFFGVTCFLFVSRQYFKNKSFLFYLVSDFFLNLSITKLFTQCFLNPFEYQISEFWGLGICVFIFIIRLIKKK